MPIDKHNSLLPKPGHWFVQRLIAALMLTMMIPILVFLMVLVKLSSHGPFIFKQTRPGYHQELFTALKIRTMSHGSEHATKLGVTNSDPRITRVGKILRMTKLDEIPQLWNIVRGDMCFVGPRPIPIALDSRLRDEIPGFEARYAVPPGLTSLAQVCVHENGLEDRLVSDWRERFEAEQHYIRMRCVWYDLAVIGLTGLYVLRKVSPKHHTA